MTGEVPPPSMKPGRLLRVWSGIGLVTTPQRCLGTTPGGTPTTVGWMVVGLAPWG
jgi:hypothetical protein